MEPEVPLMHAALPAPSSAHHSAPHSNSTAATVTAPLATLGGDELLASLQVGEALTAEVLTQIQRLITERR